MNIFFFVFSLIIGATVTLTMALRAWQRGGQRALFFSLLLLSLFVGTFSYAMELWAVGEQEKFIWLVIKYVGMVFSPLFWLLFALHYTERRKFLQSRYYLIFSIIPVLTLVLLGTTRMTGWVLRISGVEGDYLAYEYAPYYWVYAAYSYLLFVYGGGLIFRWLRKNQILRLLQWIGLMIGVLIPFAANLLNLLKIPFWGQFDSTGLGLTVGVLMVGWAMFGLDFSGVNPIARESLIESLKDGVIVIDLQRVITDINPSARYMVAAARSPIGQPLETFISSPITLPTLDMTDTYPHQEISLRNTEGALRDIDLRVSPLVDRSRVLRGWLLLLRDITEQKQLQNELKIQSLRNAALAEIELAINQPHELVEVLKRIVHATVELLPAPGGATIFIWNEETKTFDFTESTLPRAEVSQFMRRAKQGKGSAPWIIHTQQPKIVPDTREDPFGDHEILKERGIRAYAGLPLISDKKTVGVLYANDRQPHIYSKNDLQFLVTLSNRAANAIHRVQQFSQVQQQAITDHVTGIHNRRQLFNLGELEFRRARRFNRPLSAIMLDIDHFKKVNDTYGHEKGDQVLRALAQFLKIHLREFDILGRYGGEEFVIVLPGADLANARNVAFRLRDGVQERPMVNGSVNITVSLGVAQLSEGLTDFQALMNRADKAMYAAKRAGRNRVAWE